MPEKIAPVIGTTLRTSGPVPADPLGSERHRYANNASPDELGTDAMAVVDVAERGKNPVSKHYIQPECGE